MNKNITWTRSIVRGPMVEVLGDAAPYKADAVTYHCLAEIKGMGAVGIQFIIRGDHPLEDHGIKFQRLCNAAASLLSRFSDRVPEQESFYRLEKIAKGAKLEVGGTVVAIVQLEGGAV